MKRGETKRYYQSCQWTFEFYLSLRYVICSCHFFPPIMRMTCSLVCHRSGDSAMLSQASALFPVIFCYFLPLSPSSSLSPSLSPPSSLSLPSPLFHTNRIFLSFFKLEMISSFTESCSSSACTLAAVDSCGVR